MDEVKQNFEVQQGSEKSFGLVFSIIFLVIGIYPALYREDVNLYALALSLAFILLAYFSPNLLRIPNKIWLKFGVLIGLVISPIVLMLIYFSTVLPIGLMLKIFGKDPLNRKILRHSASYWIIREQPVSSMKEPF